MRLTPRVAGFRSEYPAGFKLECMAGFVGTRNQDCIGGDSCNGRNMQIGSLKKDVRIGNNRAESPILHRHRVPHR